MTLANQLTLCRIFLTFVLMLVLFREGLGFRLAAFSVFLAAVLWLWAGCQDAGPQRLIDKANDEWVKGRNQSAAETFKTVLEIEPTGPYAEEALFRLGEIYYFDFNDHGQALNYFQG